MAALALVSPAQPPQVADQETTRVFAIIANGKRIGISVAPDEHVALSRAIKLLTRSTGGEDGETGFRMISVKLF